MIDETQDPGQVPDEGQNLPEPEEEGSDERLSGEVRDRIHQEEKGQNVDPSVGVPAPDTTPPEQQPDDS